MMMSIISDIGDWCCYKVRSTGIRRTDSLEVIHVSAHGDEKIEEELAALLHLVLHSCAFLEVVPIPDNDGKVVAA